MGLTSWAAFLPTETGAIVMGDLALTAEDLPQVMGGLMENGIDVTAVHRHMLGEAPMTVFVHYMGTGAPADLARRLRQALGRAPGALGRAPAGQAQAQVGVVAGVACSRIEEILGTRGGRRTGVPATARSRSLARRER